MRMTLAVPALVLACAAPGHAKEKQVWGLTKAGKETILFYGIPESHATTVLFNCEQGRPIWIVTPLTPSRPKKGQAVKLTLSNGGASASYDAKIGGDGEEHGFYAAADAPVEPKVVDVLKSGTTLTVTVADQKERVPLNGVAKPLAQFEAACFGKKR
jgi:hypothetical protein